MNRLKTRKLIAVLGGVALLVVLTTRLAAIELKPHPLFGDHIIGNSAEILRMWGPTTGSDLLMRTVDFDRDGPETLTFAPQLSLPDGASGTLMQQMETACGDFDGDNHDEIVVGYSSDHDPLGNFQKLNLMVPQVDPEDLTLTPGPAIEHGFVMSRRAKPGMGHTSPANIQLATGNFYAENDTSSGLNIEEFVLATRVPAGFCGQLSAGDKFGYSQALLEDLDGDGNRELAVGAPGDDDGGDLCGAVWILFLDDQGKVRYQQKISQLRGGFTGSLDEGDRFGEALASLGDCDGDGVGDLAVGVPGADDGGPDRGAIWMLYLNSDGTVKSNEIKGLRPSPPGVYTSVSGGEFHSLGLKSDSTIVAWGDNYYCQCDVPAPNENFVAVAGGGYHSLGLKSDSTITAWGDNTHGACNEPEPNADFLAIAGGGYFSMGLKADGSVVVWGNDWHGQLNVPEPNTDFVAVDGGYYHCLGLKSDGSIVAWGKNDVGQCDVPAPNENFVAVAGCGHHSLGLKSDGTIVAWGENDEGQLNVPDPNENFVAVAGVGHHSLGLKSDGTIVAWGENDEGQCDVPAPNADFVAAAGGGNHSLGLKSDGAIVAWGDNDKGQCPGSLLNDGDGFGYAVEQIGDLDGNGVAELAVAAPCDDDDVENGGAVWILFGEADGSMSSCAKISGTEGSIAGLLHAGDWLGDGDALAWLGDAGLDSALAVGALRDDDGGAQRGAVWILFLDANGQAQSHTKISDTSGGFTGELEDNDYFGYSVACLQTPDHDGNPQIAVGTPGRDGPGGSPTNMGGVWLLSLDADNDGNVVHHHELDILNGVTDPTYLDGDYIGSSIAALGDLDGNGTEDLAVGAYGTAHFYPQGEVYVLGLDDVDNDVSIVWDIRNHANGKADIYIELMELVAGQPSTLATAFVEHSNFTLLGSARFAVTAGDFDLDGVDEIVVAGYRDTSSPPEIFLKIFAYDHADGVLVEKDLGGTGSQSLSPLAPLNAHFAGTYLDRIELTTGPLDPASTRDYIVLAEEERLAWLDGDEMMASIESRFTPISVNPDWTLTWHSDSGQTFFAEQSVTIGEVPTGQPVDWYYWFTGKGLGVELVDLNVDGVNEIVAAGVNKLCVYQTSVGPGGEISCNLVGEADLPLWFGEPVSPLQVADLDAEEDEGEVPPYTNMWQPEIIVAVFDQLPYSHRDLRVFSAALDTQTPPGITGLELVAEAQEALAGRPATLACGDFDGDALTLGVPYKYHYADVVQPLVVLNTPPVHFDVLNDTIYDVCGCFSEPGCECFVTRYSQEEVTETTAVTNVHSDWAAGVSADYVVDMVFVKWKVKMSAIYGEHFSKTDASTHTFAIRDYQPTEGWPKMKATVTSYDFYEYPVFLEGELINYVGVADPTTSEIVTRWLQYPDPEWNDSSNPVRTDPANLFSYRSSRPTVGDPGVGAIWYEPEGYSVVPPMARDCPYWEMTYTDIENVELEKSWDFAMEESGYAGTYASSGYGGFDTHTTSITEEMSLYGDKGNLAAGLPDDASYEVYPFIYRSTSGAVVVDFAVKPTLGFPGEDTFWEFEYQIPDLAFVLPYLYYDEHGWPYAQRQYLSPDIRVVPRQVSVGDTVRIAATLHNFSIADQPDTVQVAFYYTDSNGSWPVPIVDVAGDSTWTTDGGIADQDTATVNIDWVVPGTVFDLPRIYAAIDPNGLIAETHDESANRDNNRGFTYLYTVGPTAVEPGELPTAFALHQNYPNPFNPATVVSFSLPQSGATTLKIYNVAGALVATLVDEELPAGVHKYIWDGRNERGRRVSSGVYFYRVESGSFVASEKMLLLK